MAGHFKAAANPPAATQRTRSLVWLLTAALAPFCRRKPFIHKGCPGIFDAASFKLCRKGIDMFGILGQAWVGTCNMDHVVIGMHT